MQRTMIVATNYPSPPDLNNDANGLKKRRSDKVVRKYTSRSLQQTASLLLEADGKEKRPSGTILVLVIKHVDKATNIVCFLMGGVAEAVGSAPLHIKGDNP